MSDSSYKDLDKSAGINRPYAPLVQLALDLSKADIFTFQDPPMKDSKKVSLFGPLAAMGDNPPCGQAPIQLTIDANDVVKAVDPALQAKIENESYKLVRIGDGVELPHRFTKGLAVPYTFNLDSQTVHAHIFVLWSGNGEV